MLQRTGKKTISPKNFEQIFNRLCIIRKILCTFAPNYKIKMNTTQPKLITKQMSAKLKLMATAGLLSFIITGCKPKTTTYSETNVDNQLTFDTLTVSETYHLLDDTTNPCCVLEAVFIYPSGYNDRTILNKLSRQFVTAFFGENAGDMTPQEAIDNYAKNYIADYKEIEDDFNDEIRTKGVKPVIGFSFDETLSNEVVYNRGGILSYIISIEDYTGGAHGSRNFNNYVLNLKNGEELSEQDIFIDNFQPKLAKIIVDAIASDYQLTNVEELESVGFFNINEIYPNNNFYVDAQGITYTYNIYEIAPYAIGSIDVFLSYDKIQHLIRKDSPIAPLVFLKK